MKGALESLDSIGITDPTTEELLQVARRERPTLTYEACLTGLRRLREASCAEDGDGKARWTLV